MHWNPPPPLPGRPAYAQLLSPRRQVPASVAFVTDSNQPQPLRQPLPTACLTASEVAAGVASLQIHPWGRPCLWSPTHLARPTWPGSARVPRGTSQSAWGGGLGVGWSRCCTTGVQWHVLCTTCLDSSTPCVRGGWVGVATEGGGGRGQDNTRRGATSVASRTQKRGEACGGRGGDWAAKPSNDPRSEQHAPQCANHWAPLTRQRHHKEHRPRRPPECSDPTGDCPGPRQETATRRNVTPRGGGGGGGLIKVSQPKV